YIWQLAPPSYDVLAAESKALAKLVPGPGMWVTKHDLWRLKDGWGYSNQFNSIYHKSCAAAVRLALTVARNFKIKCRELDQDYRNSDQLVRRSNCKDWYDSSLIAGFKRLMRTSKSMTLALVGF
ncbi:MAG: hypothetical protein ACKPKO_16815, partial [Candidatus Fonsibacter sp.]